MHPEAVSAVGGSYLRDGVEDIAFLTLQYPGGVLRHIHVSWLNPKKVRQITIVGEKRMITWDEYGQSGPVMVYDRSVVQDRQYDTFGEFQLLTHDGDVVIPRVAPFEPLSRQAGEFLQRYLPGGEYGRLPLYRRIATGYVHPLLSSLAARRRITDSTNGFRTMRLSLFDDPGIDLDQRWLDSVRTRTLRALQGYPAWLQGARSAGDQDLPPEGTRVHEDETFHRLVKHPQAEDLPCVRAGVGRRDHCACQHVHRNHTGNHRLWCNARAGRLPGGLVRTRHGHTPKGNYKAHARGATYRGRPCGSMGDAGCFSFYPAKNLGTYGDGGAIVTNREDLAQRLAMLRNYGQTERYCHTAPGWNSHLDSLQAAVLRVKLRRLDGWNDLRRQHADLYRSACQRP